MLLRFAIMRPMAVLLSLSFIWLFVACESLCSIRCLGASERDRVGSSRVRDDSHEADCCPITKSPDAALSERSLFAHAQNSDQPSTVIISEHLLRQLRPRHFVGSVQYSSSDPPFHRLITLRV